MLRRRKEKVRDEVGTPLSRFVRGLLYRLMVIPTILAVLVTCLVVTATHPSNTNWIAKAKPPQKEDGDK